MELKLNRSKLKLKHFLNVQKECKNYPTDEDYLYELISALEENDMLYEPFTSTFSKRNVKSFTKSLPEDDEEKPLVKHLEKLKSLTEEGILEMIEEGGVNKSKFKLKTHPWL